MTDLANPSDIWNPGIERLLKSYASRLAALERGAAGTLVGGGGISTPNTIILMSRQPGVSLTEPCGEAMQLAIDLAPENSEIIFDYMFLTEVTIILRAHRYYRGRTPSRYNHPHAGGGGLKKAIGADLEWLAASEAFYNNMDLPDEGIVIERVVFDGNQQDAVNQENPALRDTLPTNALTLCAWGARVFDNDVYNCDGDGIVISTQTRDASFMPFGYVIACRIMRNWIWDMGPTSKCIYLQGPGNITSDHYVEENICAFPSGYGIFADSCPGDHIMANHTYGQQQSGIVAGNGYATIIAHNYVEQFGVEKDADGFYFGILVNNCLGPRDVLILGNHIYSFVPTPVGHLRGIGCHVISEWEQWFTVIGNTYRGGGLADDIAYTFEFGGSGKLHVRMAGNGYMDCVDTYVQPDGSGGYVHFEPTSSGPMDILFRDFGAEFLVPQADKARLYVANNGGYNAVEVLFDTNAPYVLAQEVP